MSTKKATPKYQTPPGTRCPECGELCRIVPLLNEFDYAPARVTHGLSGTFFPNSWGDPVSSCCLAPIDDYIGDDYE